MKQAVSTIAAGVLALGLFAAPAGSQSKRAGALDQLKALAGSWEATMPDGEKFTSNIRTVSNGTAVEETFNDATHNQMVTMYMPDGTKVALTHYCSMGNQPRMETAALESGAKQFDFGFVGATNLVSDSDPHMQHMVLEVVDADHFSETWTMSIGGKDTTETFHFVRKKA